MDPIQLLAQHLAAESSLKQDQINLICSHFRVEKVHPEARIATQGRPYGKLVFVADGILRVFVVTPDGDEVVKNFVVLSDNYISPKTTTTSPHFQARR
jgi:hypothetical protein